MTRPSKCITGEKAKAYQENWIKSRAGILDEALGYDDTRDFTFSVSELQEYLDYVKEKSKEQGINDPGIRIYFAAYPEIVGERNYSTVFLAPTRGDAFRNSNQEGEDDNNYKIDPLNDSQSGWPPRIYNP